MKINRVSVDIGLYQDLVAQFLAFCTHLEGRKEVSIKPPTLESVYLSLHMILSGLKNAKFYTSSEIANELELLAGTFRDVEGPKR
jgi:hypothetical protein